VKYESCVLAIKRKATLPWKGVELGSGFEIQLTYAPKVQVDGSVIGIDDQFDLTPQLAQFLRINDQLIHEYHPGLEMNLFDYRRWARRNAQTKKDILTYEFLSNVYCSPKDAHELSKCLVHNEKDPRVRKTFVENEEAIAAASERLKFVSQSEASTWWYLYWVKILSTKTILHCLTACQDDLWRRNHDVVSALQTHAEDFDPHYPTSIAYRLLPRAVLESFLTQRGLLTTKGKGFIHTGVLNKLYFRLNQIVFKGSSKVCSISLLNSRDI